MHRSPLHETGSAGVACPPAGTVESVVALKDDQGRFSRPVEALLTDVVIDLRKSWIAGPAGCWTRIYSIRDIASTDLDKRVSAALYEGFFHFSQFLGCLEVLLLQCEQGSAKFEETLLGVEQHFVHGSHYFRGLGLIADRQSALAQVDSAVDGAHGTADQRKIHTSSPSLGKDGVADSTVDRDTTVPAPRPGENPDTYRPAVGADQMETIHG